MLKTSETAALFRVSPVTIKRWTDAFSEYLSHTAKTTDGVQRRFTTDDLKVFALIALMKEQGNTFELIHASLKNGDRADPPQSPTALTPVTNSQQLALTERIQSLENELEQERALRHDAEGQVKSLEKQIDKLLDRLLGRD